MARYFSTTIPARLPARLPAAAAAVVCAAVYCVLTARAGAQSVLTGRVFADSTVSRPIPGAEVSVIELRRGTRSEADGSYLLGELPSGRYTVTVRRPGFSPLQAHARFSGRDTIAADFELVAVRPVALDTVSVTGKWWAGRRFDAFEARRALGNGSFLARADLDKEGNRQLSEVLTRLSGVRIIRLGSGDAAVATTHTSYGQGSRNNGGDAMDRRRGAPPACYSQVFVDGVRVFIPEPNRPLFNINSIITRTVHAVEFYSGSAETPAEFTSNGAQCGTLILWTKTN